MTIKGHTGRAGRQSESALPPAGPAAGQLTLFAESDGYCVASDVPWPASTGVLLAGAAGSGLLQDSNALLSSNNVTGTAGVWPPELTRRLRVLLHTLPLDALRHYDGLGLALRVLDIVIDRMGLEGEATREAISRQLAPVLCAMDQAAEVEPSLKRHDLMVDKLLAGLRNDADGRRTFREEYTALGPDGCANRHYVEFRLLCDSHRPDGSIVLRATNEAANLYLRLLDLDIEDAQAATEAVVQSELERGRFDEAVLSAHQARIQSVPYREKVAPILRDSRRDVDRVDWREEVPRLLEAALEHIGRRMAVETSILDAAADRMAALDTDDGASGCAVAQVCELTHDCYRRHTELHGEPIGARNVFLVAQAAQSFSRGTWAKGARDRDCGSRMRAEDRTTRGKTGEGSLPWNAVGGSEVWASGWMANG